MTLALLSGTIIDEKYEVLELLGTGGYGSVYKAKQIGIERQVAIKLLHIAATDDAENIERFRREGLAMASFQHANIPTVYQFGIWQGRIPYIAMEYLQGHSLRAELSEKTTLKPERAISITLSICAALAYAHSHGVVHRDLKPENIFLSRNADEELIKVCDFGLARFLPTSKNASELETLTATGLLIGSSNYMSPEQCHGKRSDERSDIYSLSCILFEMLTGQPPFVAENPIALIHMHINAAIPQLTWKTDLNKVIWKGLQKDPALRYQTMSELDADLNAVGNGRSLNIRISKTSSSFLNPKIALSALMIILIAVAAFIYHQAKIRAQNTTASLRINQSSQAISAKRLATQAALLAKQGKYLEAKKLFEEAVTITQALPRAQDQTQDISSRLTPIYIRLGLFQQALDSSKRTWELTKNSPIERKRANALNMMAEVYEQLGQYPEALKVRREALKHVEDEEHKSALEAYLAQTYYNNHQLTEAKQIVQSILEKEDKVNPLTYVASGFLRASIYALEKNKEEAYRVEDATIEKARQLITTSHALTARGIKDSPYDAAQLRMQLTNMIKAYAQAGDKQGTSKSLEKLFKLCDLYELPVDDGITPHLLSVAHTCIATGAFENATVIYGKIWSSTATANYLKENSMINLAQYLFAQKNTTEAEKLLLSYLQSTADSSKKQVRVTRGRIMNALAKSYLWHNQNPRKIKELTRQAKIISDENLDPSNLEDIELAFSVGDLEEHLKEFDSGIATQTKTLSAVRSKEISNLPIAYELRSLRSMANCYAGKKDYPKAKKYFAEAIALARENIKTPGAKAEYELILFQAITLYTQLDPSKATELKNELSEVSSKS
ncbi:MAG: protein kinase [Candidatus Obscuribacterales bacterium]|jgi:serine/threonine-protein kinase|nr:protein kinase [Candidatus Obscuribacterales bacterium]